jgi:hypothetical protein
VQWTPDSRFVCVLNAISPAPLTPDVGHSHLPHHNLLLEGSASAICLVLVFPVLMRGRSGQRGAAALLSLLPTVLFLLAVYYVIRINIFARANTPLKQGVNEKSFEESGLTRFVPPSWSFMRSAPKVTVTRDRGGKFRAVSGPFPFDKSLPIHRLFRSDKRNASRRVGEHPIFLGRK